MKFLTIILLLISTITFSQKINYIMYNSQKMILTEVTNDSDYVVKYTAKSIESSNGEADGSTISFFTKDYTYIVDFLWVGINKKQRFVQKITKMNLWGHILYKQEFKPLIVSSESISTN